MDSAILTNLTLNALGTILMLGSFVFIIIIKLHLKKREEELNRKLEDLLLLTDKLIDHAEEIKDKGIIFDQKEVSIVPRETTPKESSRS